MAGMRYQPQGRARLDQSNPLVRGLVFASVAGGADLISGVLPVRMGAASTSAFEQGKTLYTPGTTSDGWYWPLPAGHPLYTIGTQDTIFVLAKRIAGASFNNLLGVPYRSGSWATPFYAWGLSGQSNNTTGAYTLATSGSARISAISVAGLFQDGVTRAYGATRSGTRIRFYNDKNQYGADATITAASPDWANKQPLVLFNRSNSAPGEGMSAHAGLVLVWSRELTPDEWASIAQNPWQLFADPYEDDEIAGASAPTPPDGSIVSSLLGVSLNAQMLARNTGAFSSMLSSTVLSSSGAVAAQPSGTLSGALASVTMAASGGVLDRGQIAATLMGASMAGSGTVASNSSGAFASQLSGVSAFFSDGQNNSAQGATRPYRWRILRRGF